LLKVQPNSFLGIYLAKDHATVVCVEVKGRERRLAGCFSVSVEQTEQPDPQALAQRIAAGCTERHFKFTETAVALDCTMFMQHSVHSEFSDFKKIAQTVRFDTEEALGTDATDVAIAFKIDSVDKTGSNLSVFTAPKKLLGELLAALQTETIDPVSVEPDVSCLARFVCQNVSLPAEARPLFAFLSRRSGYFLTPLVSVWQAVSPTPAVAMRTFLLSEQNRTDLLTRQVSMTVPLLQVAGTVNRLEVFDAVNSVDCDDITKKLTIQTESIDLIASTLRPLGAAEDGSSGVAAENLADCSDMVELAIAYGAAIVQLDLPQNANWRSDFMPYQAKVQRLQNTLKFLSAVAVVFILAVGFYGLIQAMQVNKYRSQLRVKFAKEFSSVMFGQSAPDKSKEAVRRLGTALRRIKEGQKGFSLTGEEAVAGKLSMVFEAFNKCASATGLNIESINITDKTITINGDTSGPDSTLKVFEALKQAGLNVLQQRISSEGGRSNFGVTVEPKKIKS
jgi:hypothetical protein